MSVFRIEHYLTEAFESRFLITIKCVLSSAQICPRWGAIPDTNLILRRIISEKRSYGMPVGYL